MSKLDVKNTRQGSVRQHKARQCAVRHKIDAGSLECAVQEACRRLLLVCTVLSHLFNVQLAKELSPRRQEWDGPQEGRQCNLQQQVHSWRRSGSPQPCTS